jgi:hypothetical protein
LADDTSNIRVVLWDTNHISLIENGTIKEGEVIEILGGDIRNMELHLGGFGDIKLSSAVLDNVQEKPIVQKKTIDKIMTNENVLTRAFVVQLFGPTFYFTCPECNKKLEEGSKCSVHGIVNGKKNAILTLIIDDGTGNIRAVIFSEQLKKIASEDELENTESFMAKRNELIGKEIIVEGSARKNKLSEALEIFVNDLREVDLDKLVEELEA